jgi:7,8-dihydropterin-6-yl-methyl-4-(beta-D-ribofuranosyl)aminobenzene 5'-phosphate synthase
MARQANNRTFPWILILVSLCNASASLATAGDASPVRVNILYDAFGKASGLTKDWGYAALIEYRGKRILFDTGNNPDILAKNARASSLDLSRLDLVILSHRHADHMGGMEYLLAINPKVKIYAPRENFGVYGSSLPGTFYRRDESLQPEQRYYDGSPPATVVFGSAWPRAHFELIDSATAISPGLHLISLVSDKPGTLELRELSLAIETPDGLVLVVGCSHPGIENIVQAAASIDRRIHLIIGGLHLVTANDADIARTVTSLQDTWKVDYIAPGHCTGEATFAALRKAFGDHYLYAGLGTRLTVAGVPTVAMITAATMDRELRTER